MIDFYALCRGVVFAVERQAESQITDIDKLKWLLGNAQRADNQVLDDAYIGPRASMITPWSTNAVEITQNMGISGIMRIERFIRDAGQIKFDQMTMQRYDRLDQGIFALPIMPESIKYIGDIAAYNIQESLSLSTEEIEYLYQVSERLGRKLTDTEVFGFSQVNSEHCRHKIFNGEFIIDGKTQPHSLFKLIKKTAEHNNTNLVSAYKDNVAFISGTAAVQFAPSRPDKPSLYGKKPFEAVLSLKAETHNFPTTVEPFSGAATGSGGEIRDRMAGGQGSIPLAGTAVYMTAYSRVNGSNRWEEAIPERPWLYQTPLDILIKASNGASDFGNKFGQPLICGSILTYEAMEGESITAFDKVIMLAGGIGYTKLSQAQKMPPQSGDKIVVMGGDNYRIGMGGAAVSSVDTGASGAILELNAVQRSNPEMQKRIANAIRALVESDKNPITSIHDHGAGGHLNCLSELVEDTGGFIRLNDLPVGDPTLSAREILGNESQERMGLVLPADDYDLLKAIADRERAPIYDVGVVTGDGQFVIKDTHNGDTPVSLGMHDLFGSSPKTIMTDRTRHPDREALVYDNALLVAYVRDVLRLEAVACKDWLTNKVDRCVGGRVAKQQCAGELQLPLNNCGVMALDYDGLSGIATSIGHAPGTALIDARAGSRLSVVEALTNLIWAPIADGLSAVSLSANWMWPCRNPGEDSRLYSAVEALSQYCISLGVNVPTGKDSLSMKQKYRDMEVLSPGTVIVSTVGLCSDINKIVEPVLREHGGDIYYLDMSDGQYSLGGSSFAQILAAVGDTAPDAASAEYVQNAFAAVQIWIKEGMISAGHDIGSGGLVTSLLEMCFPSVGIGADIELSHVFAADHIAILFSEGPGLILQSSFNLVEKVESRDLRLFKIGVANNTNSLNISFGKEILRLAIPEYRDIWYCGSYLLDKHQTAGDLAEQRFKNYHLQPLQYSFPSWHVGSRTNLSGYAGKRPLAAIIREKGSNSEREMAHALYLAGWDIRDVHMTDIVSGRETLDDVQFLGAVGGFSNSDVLGSAKGWAGTFLYNKRANDTLKRFFARPDVLSIGICNGCQLFMELDLICPDHADRPKMMFNDSGKHESAFTSVKILKNNSVMLSSFEGAILGVWISHGEGKFVLPQEHSTYNIVGEYGYSQYPANPNGSDYNVAILSSADGRHLVTMPHIERSIFRWNWAYYPHDRCDEISPWIQAFVNAHEWAVGKKS